MASPDILIASLGRSRHELNPRDSTQRHKGFSLVLDELDREVASAALAPTLQCDGVPTTDIGYRELHLGALRHASARIDVNGSDLSIFTGTPSNEHLIDVHVVIAAAGADQAFAIGVKKRLRHRGFLPISAAGTRRRVHRDRINQAGAHL